MKYTMKFKTEHKRSRHSDKGGGKELYHSKDLYHRCINVSSFSLFFLILSVQCVVFVKTKLLS